MLEAASVQKLLVQVLLITLLAKLLAWHARKLARIKALNKLPGPSTGSFLNGNMRQLNSLEGWGFHQSITDQYGSVARVHGLLGDKKIYTSDPRAMYDVLVKNQGSGYGKTAGHLRLLNLEFGPGIVSATGEQHRMQRKMMNPVFNIAHMKYMCQQFHSVVHRLCIAIDEVVGDRGREVECLAWMARAALELIGQAGLGYEFDPLISESRNEFAHAIKQLNPSLEPLAPYRELLSILTYLNMPRVLRALLLCVPIPKLQKVRKIIDTMDLKSREIYGQKQQALAEGDEAVLRQLARGKDIMSILLKANNEAHEGDRLPREQVIAQMTTLIFAAMDTTSGALCHILQILAEHPEYQQKIREELYKATDEAGSEDLPYKVIDNLPYLDACCRETLRLFPPVTFRVRTALKDMVLPLSSPITTIDGVSTSEIFVPRGTDVIMSIIGINRSKAIWGEDAFEWKPERWLKPHPQSVLDAHVPGVYSNTMTFSAGSTSCIGFKFSQLEMKVVLSLLLQHFSFAPSNKTVTWKMGGLQFPTVKGSKHPQMPLYITRIKRQ